MVSPDKARSGSLSRYFDYVRRKTKKKNEFLCPQQKLQNYQKRPFEEKLKMTSPALNNGNGQKESSNKGSNATLPQSPARSANEASGSSSSTSALVAPWRVFKMQLKGLLGVFGVDGMEPEEHRELGDFKLEPLNFLINRIGNDFRTIFSRIACEDWVGETESILQGKKNY
ncbi:hypothetical protein HUJ04_007625 [Dendroctonus ponderosae]|nr:hypothetical protein HUJ04_007625 [Dendroctonus ponderosae]